MPPSPGSIAGLGGVFIFGDRYMESPLDALVADMVNELDADRREEFEERAGIMEFDGKMPRAHAECLALLNVLHRHPAVLTGVTVLQVEWDGAHRWLLTTDLDVARQHVADIGVREIGVRDLAAIVEQKYGCLAMLTTTNLL
jgi:hypothetical protein